MARDSKARVPEGLQYVANRNVLLFTEWHHVPPVQFRSQAGRQSDDIARQIVVLQEAEEDAQRQKELQYRIELEAEQRDFEKAERKWQAEAKKRPPENYDQIQERGKNYYAHERFARTPFRALGRLVDGDDVCYNSFLAPGTSSKYY